MIDEAKLEKLTKEYGGMYAVTHTKRILKIIDLISDDLEYDKDVLKIAAYLHDWGGYTPWKKEGIDHAQRSKEVAEKYLTEEQINENMIPKILECIEHHHDGDKEKCTEAKLLSDADGIDYLGAVGLLREFSTKPREMRKAYESSKARITKIKNNVCLEKSKAIVENRIKVMEDIFTIFYEETFSIF